MADLSLTFTITILPTQEGEPPNKTKCASVLKMVPCAAQCLLSRVGLTFLLLF